MKNQLSVSPPAVTVQDILTGHVTSVTPDATAEEAIALMRRRNISCIIISEKKIPIGIFTERNLVAYAAQALDFSKVRIDRVMSSPVISAPSSINIYEAFGIFSEKKIRHLVIVNKKGQTAGILTLSDLTSHLGVEYFVEVKKVNKIMSRSLVSVPADSTVQDAVSIMLKRQLSCILIKRNHMPVGILTERDVTRLIYEKQSLDSITVDAVMSSPIRTIASDAPLHEASRLMKRHQCRRLGVTNREGILIGVITQSDIIKSVESRSIELLREVIHQKEEELQCALKSSWEKSLYLDNILRSSSDSAIIATTLDLTIKYFNPAAERLLEYPAQEAIGQRLEDIHAKQAIAPSRLQHALAAVSSKGEYNFTIERRSSKNDISLECRVSGIFDHDQDLVGYVLTIRDVTERKRLEDQLRMAATIDKLTGMYNRQTLDDLLSREISRSHRYKIPLSLIMADIDHFKNINDTFGHQTGDHVLREIAETFKKNIRHSDIAGRWGGEEFMIIAPQTPQASAAVMAEKLRHIIATHAFYLQQRVTISLGLTALRDHDTLESLVSRTDSALYKAKKLGRNRVEQEQ
jgi:diguanylate cyclase (GGDEF)-like protein/PAS domain S-box-containing protein